MTNVIIVGGGRVGIRLIKNLKKRAGYNITLIDSHKEIIENIKQKYPDINIITGNATKKEDLEKAGIKTANIIVIATSSDEANLLIGITAQKYENLEKVIVRTSNPSHIKMFKKLGLNEVVSPELEACSNIEKMILPDNITELAVTGKGDMELADFTVNSSKVIGKSIGEISPNKDFMIVLCNKNNNILIAENNIILEKNDVVSVIVKSKAMKKTRKYFTKSGILPI